MDNSFGKISLSGEKYNSNNGDNQKSNKFHDGEVKVSFDIEKNDLDKKIDILWEQTKLGASKLTELMKGGSVRQDKNVQGGIMKKKFNKGRRDVLKWGAVTVAGTGMEILGLKNLAEWIDKKSDEELFAEEQRELDDVLKMYYEVDKDGMSIARSSREEDVDGEMSLGQGEIKEKDIEAVSNLKENFISEYLKNEKIILDTEAKDDLEKYWEMEFAKGGKQHWGLQQSLKRLKPWFMEVKKVFQENNKDEYGKVVIPERAIYLAIIESEFKLRADSGSAVGIYQQTRNTAGNKKLRINKYFDERLNPLESARCAVEYLKDLYNQIKTKRNSEEDILKLTYALYNGYPYVRKFEKFVGDSRDALMNYRIYLRFREDRINTFLDESFKDGFFEHTIKSNETDKKTGMINLDRVARNFRVEVSDITKQYATSEFSKVLFYKKGDIIKIPVDNSEDLERRRKALEKMFSTVLSSSLENLNYPEKFIALLKVMKRERLFLEDNDDGVVVKIMKGNGLWSLNTFARKHKKELPIKVWMMLNPHIKRKDVRIPKDVEINIPEFNYKMITGR